MKEHVRVGTAVLERQAYAQANQTSVGWTSPTIFYERMRSLDPAIQELNTLIGNYISRQAFRDSWKAYYAQWTKFYAESQEWQRKLTGPQIFENEAYGQQVEDFRRRYETYRAGYEAERNEKGEAPPTPVTPTPRPDQRTPSDSGIQIPWWVWMLGGVALVGGGYWIYKKALVVRDARREIDRALPDTLGGLMPGGHEVGTFVARHSPANDPSRPLVMAPVYHQNPPRPILAPIGIAGDYAPSAPPHPMAHSSSYHRQSRPWEDEE